MGGLLLVALRGAGLLLFKGLENKNVGYNVRPAASISGPF